jgi:glycosyltransferase involved in cell wall biosynthesis
MSLKVLHLSSFDLVGGAARAAYRIHQGLQNCGTDSQMLVQYKVGNDPTVAITEDKVKARARSWMDAIALKGYSHQQLFSPQWFPDAIIPKILKANPDVIHINWVCNGFLQVETLGKLNKPLVWTFHDMWTFTGGCHYSEGCERYTKSCGQCPQLNSSRENDLSRRIWQRKADAWRSLNLVIVTPSHWMATCARSSSLFTSSDIEVIPYGLNLRRYKPVDWQLAREILNLPLDKQLILFCSMSLDDPRKGYSLLQQALKQLAKTTWRERVELVILGGTETDHFLDSQIKVYRMGRLSDDLSLALVYAAVDVFTAPSTEDNLPNTVLEAIACGTPCVAFEIGGMPDMIEHQQNGYLAKPYKVEDLAKGITWILEDSERHQKLRRRAREKAEQEFTSELQSSRYVSLFHKVLNQSAVQAR